MPKFLVGELAILQRADYFQEWEGALGVVVGGLARRNPMNMRTMTSEFVMAYAVKPLVQGATEVTCLPHQLRKIYDPNTDASYRSGETVKSLTEACILE